MDVELPWGGNTFEVLFTTNLNFLFHVLYAFSAAFLCGFCYCPSFGTFFTVCETGCTMSFKFKRNNLVFYSLSFISPLNFIFNGYHSWYILIIIIPREYIIASWTWSQTMIYTSFGIPLSIIKRSSPKITLTVLTCLIQRAVLTILDTFYTRLTYTSKSCTAITNIVRLKSLIRCAWCITTLSISEEFTCNTGITIVTILADLTVSNTSHTLWISVKIRSLFTNLTFCTCSFLASLTI